MNRCHPSFKFETEPVPPVIPTCGELNRYHPSLDLAESVPPLSSIAAVPGRTNENGATRKRCHASFHVGRTGVNRQLNSRLRLNRCHPSVARPSANRGHPSVQSGRTGATRQLNSGGEGEWCHARVRRRRGVPALGLVFLRQTAAVGAGLASLLACSAAEYPAWLILLKLA